MRLALAVPPALERRLVADLEQHGHLVAARCNGAAHLAAALAGTACDAALVSAGADHLDADVIAAADAAGVRVVVLVDGESERRRVAALALAEHVPVDSPWHRIEQLLHASPPPETAPRSGRVVAVWGPAGAPGRTTLAIAIAAEVAAAGFSTALADADTHSGSVAPSLGLLDESPGFAAACRLAGAGGLDTAQLERVGQRYASGHGGFWVLTGIGRPSRWPELSSDRVERTLRACRDWVDVTVVDTSASLENDEEISSDLFAPRRNAATIASLRSADHVVAVGTGDPVGLARFLRAHVDLVETIGTDRVTVVMNRVRASAIGLNPGAQVEQALRRFGGITDPVLVPHDQGGLDAAVLTGRTLRDAAPRSPARAAIGALVQERLLPEPVTRARRRRALRMRPALG